MKRADKLGVDRVLIVGEKELSEGSAILRDMKTKAQETVPLDDIVEALKARIKT
jgi:histidyl-tRNA synthetase